ncbi:SDR family oxidoreductase [Asanoa sp. NPDC050611]|uniref:SDR family NAD(P)-dependent oxidoreductase n=1 Tax=Asanoa sp. NPDC050611 TaxID=3157098 RepID=UPI003408CF3A
MEGIAGQVAVVVGAGAGIGRATSALLAARGMTVACLDRDERSARETAEAIGSSASAHGADVTDADSVRAAFQAVADAYGQVHAVVNCAGVQGPTGAPSHLVDLDAFDQAYAVNLRGALVVSQVAVSHMLPHRYGRIVHVASIAGKEGNPNMIGYSATKAGMIGMVKAQGKEYARDGITVNALAPAVIDTGFLTKLPDEVVRYMLDRIPMGRAGTVDDAARLIAWVVSPECGFTTGFTFDLSGGRATY